MRNTLQYSTGCFTYVWNRKLYLNQDEQFSCKAQTYTQKLALLHVIGAPDDAHIISIC